MNTYLTKLKTTSLLLAYLGLASSASAATYTWSGLTGGDTDLQTNWGSPTWANGDTAEFDDASNGQIIDFHQDNTRALNNAIAPATTKSITIINSGTATLDSNTTSIFRIADNYTLNMQSGQFNVGSLSLVGNSTAGDALIKSAHYIQSGDAALVGGGDFQMGTGSAQFLGGTVSFDGSGRNTGAFLLGNTNNAQIGGNTVLTFVGNMDLGTSATLDILATSTGSLSLGGITDWAGILDFADGVSSSFGMTIAGYDATAFELEYTEGDLLYNGDNSAAFADVFSVTGNTLTTAVPEPSSTAFLGLAGLALILRRRK